MWNCSFWQVVLAAALAFKSYPFNQRVSGLVNQCQVIYIKEKLN